MISDALTISGPGAGLMTIDASGNDPTPESTLSDGISTNDGDGSRVFNATAMSEISGLTLTGGDTAEDGGAVYSTQSLMLRDSAVTGNVARSGGGLATTGSTTVMGSRFEGNSTMLRGGGINAHLSSGAVVISGSEIVGNSAVQHQGGGVRVELTSASASAEISENWIAENTAQAAGGGLQLFVLEGASAEVSHNTLTRNSSLNNGGGGMSVFVFGSMASAVTINDNLITENSGRRGGGARLTIESPDFGAMPVPHVIDFRQNLVANNRSFDDVSSSFSHGGGILAMGASAGGVINIANSIVRSNIALEQGGGMWLESDAPGATIVVSETLVSENQSTLEGGGIFVLNRSGVRILNSSISGNRASLGGGILARNFAEATTEIVGSTISSNLAAVGGGVWTRSDDASTTHVWYSTITANLSNYGGGGIYVDRGALDVGHSIVAGNSDDASSTKRPDFAYSAAGSPGVSVHFSLIGDSTGAEGLGWAEAPLGSPDANGNLIGKPIASGGLGVIDPQLSPLGYYGSPTLTHLLKSTSPARDAGDPLAMAGQNDVPEFDQRGEPNARVFGDQIDMGAIEWQGDLVAPTELVVDTLEDESDGDYSAGDLSLREALELINLDGFTSDVTFSPATYGGTISLVLGELVVLNPLVLDGPGASRLTIAASLADPRSNARLRTGGRVFRLGHNTVSGAANQFDVEIEGVTIRDGWVNGAGGGILAHNRALRVVDSVLSGNTATVVDPEAPPESFNRFFYGGGAIAIRAGDLTIVDSELSHNRALQPNTKYTSAIGGAVRAGQKEDFSAGRVVITGSDFVDNHAQWEGGALTVFGDVTIESSRFESNGSVQGSGGGIYFVTRSESAIRNSQVIGNRAVGAGGGIRIRGDGGNVVIEDSIVSQNIVVANAGGFSSGGGIIGSRLTTHAADWSLSILGSTISDNATDTTTGTDGTIPSGGGILASGLTTLLIADSSFLNNSSQSAGGLAVGSLLGTTIVNTTIAGNLATRYGAGGLAVSGPVSISHSTIAYNQASPRWSSTDAGGGIYLNSSGPYVIDHTVIAKNVDTSGRANDFFVLSSVPAGAVTVHYSLIGDNRGSGLVEAPVGSPDANGNLIGGPENGLIDPLLGPPAYHGGPTYLDRSGILTYEVLPGSPAIDAGDPAFEPADPDGDPLTDAALPFDQRGDPFVRVFGGRVDMGALEWQPNPLPGDYNFDRVVDAADYAIWRNTLDSMVDLRADGNSNGKVDAEDYRVWKMHFGEVLLQSFAGGGAAFENSVQVNHEHSVIKSAANFAGVSREAFHDARHMAFADLIRIDNAFTESAPTVHLLESLSAHDESDLLLLAIGRFHRRSASGDLLFDARLHNRVSEDMGADGLPPLNRIRKAGHSEIEMNAWRQRP